MLRAFRTLFCHAARSSVQPAPPFQLRLPCSFLRPHPKSFSSVAETKKTGTLTTASGGQESSKEDFYNYYLRKVKWRPRPYSAGLWLHGLQSATYEAQLPEHLRHEPLRVLEDPAAELGQVEKCLLLIMSRIHEGGKIDRNIARQRYRDAQMGCKALSWILENKIYDRHDLKIYLFLSTAIACALVAEGRADAVRDWLLVTDRVKAAMSDQRPDLWRGPVLRGLIEGQAYWEKHGFNTAIETYLKMRKEAKERRVHIPLNPVRSFFNHELGRNHNRGLDAEIYDRLIRDHEGFAMNDDARSLLQLSRLEHGHPRHPSGSSSLKLLRMYSEGAAKKSPFVQSLFRMDHPRTMFFVYWHIVKTAQRLHADKQIDDAKWVLDFGRDLAPEAFDMKPAILSVAEDANKIVHIDSGAAASEMDLGRAERAESGIRYGNTQGYKDTAQAMRDLYLTAQSTSVPRRQQPFSRRQGLDGRKTKF